MRATTTFLHQRPAFALGVVVVSLAVALCLTACSTRPIALRSPPEQQQPEIATGWQTQPGRQLQGAAVAAAHPLAVQAGVQMLRAGGSAVDAAVAVQLVLGLVEPQSSGLGGGAFLLHSDGRQLQVFDGRETAPTAATEDLLLQADGTPLPFHQAAVGGRAVGVPGVLRMLELAHRQHGVLPWSALMEPAITLAEQGFPIGARLHAQLQQDPYLRHQAAARAYFYQPDGQPLPIGFVRTNPAYAQLLRGIAHTGSAALYTGPVAQAMVDAVRQHPSNPGHLALADLAQYQPVVRSAMCWDVPAPLQRATIPLRACGVPPPSSGTLALGQIFGMLAHHPAANETLTADGVPSANWLHHYAEAARLAFADRAQYVADPDFVAAPGGDWHTLLQPRYLQQRAQSIGPTRAHHVQAGIPVTQDIHRPYAAMPTQPEYGTSHLSIVDAQGRAVSMTSSIEDQFGSRLMVHGFLLNNQLTDFSFVPRNAQGLPVANRVQPGKRPRSSMSPMMLVNAHTGQPQLIWGSPGGAHIIHYTAKVLQGTLGWNLSPQQSIDLPNFSQVGGPLLLERARLPASTMSTLRARGHTVQETALTSGLQALQRATPPSTAAAWLGGADPRREGTVQAP